METSLLLAGSGNAVNRVEKLLVRAREICCAA
jgi:hypothetical protein